MLCYKDTEFCASPDCKNECGRQPTVEDFKKAKEQGLLMAWGYWCGVPEKQDDETII